MKKKYYLRGLGIGVLVTALLFVVALVFHNPRLSDAEIRKQARELGMIDAAEADDQNSEDQDDQNQDTQVQDADAEDTAKLNEDEVTEETTENEDGSTTTKTTETLTGDEVEEAPDGRIKPPVAPDNDSSASSSSDSSTSSASTGSDSASRSDNTSSDSDSDSHGSSDSPAATGKKVTITVTGGQNSDEVASALASAGLVDNGRAFDTYLESNGYDRIIRPGSYSIPQGSSYEQIAQILIGR